MATSETPIPSFAADMRRFFPKGTRLVIERTFEKPYDRRCSVDFVDAAGLLHCTTESGSRVLINTGRDRFRYDRSKSGYRAGRTAAAYAR